jgi:hypothetical protein
VAVLQLEERELVRSEVDEITAGNFQMAAERAGRHSDGGYLRFFLSYRDVEELLVERGLDTDHVTVWRWVQRYAPELERRLKAHLKSTNKSWRVDETFVRVKEGGRTSTERWIRREALEFLAEQDGRGRQDQARLEVVTRGWRRYVFQNDGTVDRKAYVFCCLDRLRSALRRRDRFVAPSIRYADARIGLLNGEAWEASRSTRASACGSARNSGGDRDTHRVRIQVHARQRA